MSLIAALFLLIATPDLEMLVHVPLLSHGSAKKVLLIGEEPLAELLRHPTVEAIVLLSPTPSSNPKVKSHAQDPLANLKATEETVDAIHSTSPLTPECASLASDHLAKDGILATRSTPSPSSLPHACFYLAITDTGPTYFLLSTKNPSHLKTPKKTLSQRLRALLGPLHYYTPAIHKASFALPKDAEQTLKKRQKSEGKRQKCGPQLRAENQM